MLFVTESPLQSLRIRREAQEEGGGNGGGQERRGGGGGGARGPVHEPSHCGTRGAAAGDPKKTSAVLGSD